MWGYVDDKAFVLVSANCLPNMPVALTLSDCLSLNNMNRVRGTQVSRSQKFFATLAV